MEIVRLKRGYRIRCTDAEFFALGSIFEMAYGELTDTVIEERIYATFLSKEAEALEAFYHAGSLQITEDRRG